MTTAGHDGRLFTDWLLIVLVIVAALPELAASWQFLLITGHFRRNHYRDCAPRFPRAAVLIPAWNEAAVIGTSIDRLMALEYPADALRVYVVDDASTDDTPEVIAGRQGRYPGRVFHLRREQGGQGKAHTLNHGLDVILADDWMQVLLITDADVIFEPDSLRTDDPAPGRRPGGRGHRLHQGRQPSRQLPDPVHRLRVRHRAGGRAAGPERARDDCLPGRRSPAAHPGQPGRAGRPDRHSSLAEDTITTFQTQLAGRRVVFEPHATVWAEEPGTISGLWKQRLRWARGNVQVTRRYRRLWFRPAGSRGPRAGRGQLRPVLVLPVPAAGVHDHLIGGAADAVLHRVSPGLARVPRAVDHQRGQLRVHHLLRPAHRPADRARRCWRQAIFFPGAVNLAIIVYSCFPRLFTDGVHRAEHALGWASGQGSPGWLIVFIYAWLTLSMAVAYLAKVVEPHRFGRVLSPVLIYLVGYGSVLCACTFASYVLELRRAEARWDKTEKTGKAQGADVTMGAT